MFWNRDRVEADIRRIREANLPLELEKAEEAANRLQEARERGGHIGAKDVFAMVIAIFSLLLPYVLAFLVIMGLLMGIILWWIQ